ncbi:MAG: S9 family peptidase [Deltaproteobacteria bacterium]|nr:S9 family peptidase [Deltaproteobacteria bacterium]
MSRSVMALLGLTLCSCTRPAVPPQCPNSQTKQVATATKGDQRKIGALVLDGIPKLPPRIQERMGQYLNVRRTSFADWDHRSQGMLIRTRFGNTVQVHRVRTPLGAREQLTFFQEPVGHASWVPNSYDGALLLSMDRGGAENAQLYRLDLLVGKTQRLTDGKSRTLASVWSRSGKVAYGNNARNGRDFDIYLSSGKDAGKIVYKGKGYFAPLHFSADGKKLLLQQYISINESKIHVLDIASGKATLVSPTTPAKAAKAAKVAKVAYRDARFAQNGKGVYLTSDLNGEFVQLYYYELKSKKLSLLTADQRWNVEAIDLSVDGKTLAVVLNEGGLSRLYLLNTRNKKLQQIKIPDGMVHHLRFSRQKKNPQMLGFTLERPTSPGDAYSYDTKRRKLVQWTRSEVGGLNADFFIPPKLIKYPTFDKRQLPAFYYKPPGEGPHPVMVYIHGGPEGQFRPYFRALIHYLLMEMGVAVIAPNVRGSDGYGKSYLLLDNVYKREDSVKDIGALLDWVGKQKELDAKKVVVYGGSYGGYMVLSSLMHYDQRLLAGVDWVGISNFTSFLQNTKAYRRDLRRAEYGDERDPKVKAFFERIAPLNHIDKINSPLFVIQGANDPRVPRSEAEQIVSAMRKGGRKVWYLLGLNEGHGFRKKENRDMATMLTTLFFEQIGLGKAP